MRMSKMINVFISIIQTILLYKDRRYLKETIKVLWQNHGEILKYNDLEDLKKFVIIGFSLFIGCFFTSFAVVFWDTIKVNSYIYKYFFTLTVDNLIISIVLQVSTSIAYVLVITKMNCFVLYYCFVCRLLRKVFNHYNANLSKKQQYSVLTQKYNKMIETLSEVDNRFSALIFFCCLLTLNELFITGYNAIQFGFNYVSYFTESIWLGFVLFYLVAEASLVNESVDKIKYILNFKEENDISIKHVQFTINVCSTDVRLTIWKIIVMRRMTILSVIGIFITYSFLIAT